MPTEFHNIDELLTQPLGTTTPPPPESQGVAPEPEQNVPQETLETESSYSEPEESHSEPKEEAQEKTESSLDEYGNQSSKEEKLYTKEEVNAMVRDRLSRGHHGQQQNQQAEQQPQGFEYKENEAGDWQQQLEAFTEQVIAKREQKLIQQQQQYREQMAQQQFQAKFEQGIEKFSDFAEVVDTTKFTDAMVLATRGLNDPAAFVYAASKRAPQDLERIARINDPYAQMMEMGKLEERLKKAPPVSKTPKPSTKIKEDLTIPHAGDKKETIEDLIAEANNKRLHLINSQRRR